jgi:hypothetical protein
VVDKTILILGLHQSINFVEPKNYRSVLGEKNGLQDSMRLVECQSAGSRDFSCSIRLV